MSKDAKRYIKSGIRLLEALKETGNLVLKLQNSFGHGEYTAAEKGLKYICSLHAEIFSLLDAASGAADSIVLNSPDRRYVEYTADNNISFSALHIPVYEMRNLIHLVFRGKRAVIDGLRDVLFSCEALSPCEPLHVAEQLKIVLREFEQKKHEAAAEDAWSELEMRCCGNTFSTYIASQKYFTRASLCIYGKPVDKEDIDLLNFFSAWDHDKLSAMAEHIVSSFLHGFISQNRDRRDRKTVLMTYQLGQEPLVQQIMKRASAEGLRIRITDVQGYHEKNSVQTDYVPLKGWFYSRAYAKRFQDELKTQAEEMKECLNDICGMIGILQFGEKPQQKTPSYLILSEKNRAAASSAAAEREQEIRVQLQTFMKPDDLSFCKAAFPNIAAGKPFDQIFEDITDCNMKKSFPYEKLQQVLITYLDKGKAAVIRGEGDNETNLRVAFQQIADETVQTLFMNCGGDLNIPHGEVFTTPQLMGTSGLLHVRDVCVKGYSYSNLRLQFTDGVITDWSCDGFESRRASQEYISETLFNSSDHAPMGEFAIGTNTDAYEVCSNWNLISRLPILLVEKMGPHIAIGDPCYAGGESGKVYNILDGKEITAKYNELTEQGTYCHFHTDITLPYEDIGELQIIMDGGITKDIMKHGLFELEELACLNEPLIRLKREE